MSDQRVKDVAREATEQGKSFVADTAETAKNAANRGIAVAQEAGDTVSNLARQASEIARDAAGRGMAAAQEAGQVAQNVARQAGAVAESAYGQSLEARDLLVRTVEQNPFLSLLVAGAVGYGLACMVKNR